MSVEDPQWKWCVNGRQMNQEMGSGYRGRRVGTLMEMVIALPCGRGEQGISDVPLTLMMMIGDGREKESAAHTLRMVVMVIGEALGRTSGTLMKSVFAPGEGPVEITRDGVPSAGVMT